MYVRGRPWLWPVPPCWYGVERCSTGRCSSQACCDSSLLLVIVAHQVGEQLVPLEKEKGRGRRRSRGVWWVTQSETGREVGNEARSSELPSRSSTLSELSNEEVFYHNLFTLRHATLLKKTI